MRPPFYRRGAGDLLAGVDRGAPRGTVEAASGGGRATRRSSPRTGPDRRWTHCGMRVTGRRGGGTRTASPDRGGPHGRSLRDGVGSRRPGSAGSEGTVTTRSPYLTAHRSGRRRCAPVPEGGPVGSARALRARRVGATLRSFDGSGVGGDRWRATQRRGR
ncbi:MAG: hypothetical protein AVDCRST_MAG49-653 [uncultured Thermomicrobiales bacterium]|uniref:Uncharacterized protein n=1 Tax=uncultured Thermomicrobiales bacterium TaxID=1645740 RepID=A0A6J4U2N2_9BACT|nr:MAG: hypothetical protein AVDCRST_MAG49-653 [uncultured Thermomicrobiales bacterium]